MTTAAAIDDDIVRRYREDGAVALRGLLDASTVERLRDAVETVLASLGEHGNEYARPGQARFAQDMFMARRPDAAGAAFRWLVFESPLAEAAGRLMGAREVRFFYDQMFVKEPGSVAPTPWHQDLPYWPLRGDQICGLWCPLDPVDLDSGGVQYVRGSHLGGRWYRPRHFGGESAYEGALGEPMPDIDATVPPADRLSWTLEPGDAIAFHGLVIHGAGGNRTAQRRRRAAALDGRRRGLRRPARHLPLRRGRPGAGHAAGG
ncbi:MAG: phytanoyl-CoA dioxygenase family protein [Rubrivivax sp.]|nr:phytanoyl-CoA dioxygenase family protein [Rubrivivax sp.]